ncbi:hypothetical protein ACMZOO_06465 [Catenovulum sp. SX2]|uniref:hypothetical protein n=1 Tax=Catenovulum sp. SX2 TaxID=3398614 RepID=UPI003F86AB83
MSNIETVDFGAQPYTGTTLIWSDQTLNSKYSAKQLTEMFSWRVADNPLDFSKGKMAAEFYGGNGTGSNGGGVRCGNIHGYQVKGTGQNILVGAEEDLWHSYGGLSAIDAIYEAIYSQVLNDVLPIGTVGVHAVLLTEPQGAYELSAVETKKGWGALMVRELCERPAHFLGSPRFTPREEYKKQVIGNIHRLRKVNRKLYQQFNSKNDFIRSFGRFLSNCANQFAFAQTCRVMHGSITPSNLALDGRWLDLTNSNFIKTNENSAGFLVGLNSFYEEPNAVEGVVTDFIYTVMKYNKTNLSAAPLLEYFNDQYEAYKYHHFSYIFGFESGAFTKYSDKVSVEALFKPCLELKKDFLTIRDQWPESFNKQDKTLLLIRSAYNYLQDKSKNQAPFTYKSYQQKEHLGFLQNFSKVTKLIYAGIQTDISFSNFCQIHMMQALKRLIMPSFYYKGRLEKEIKSILCTEDTNRIASFVSNAVEIKNWSFNPVKYDNYTLYQSNNLQIQLSEEQHCVTVTTAESTTQLNNMGECHKWLEMNKHKLQQCNFDFSWYLTNVFNAAFMFKEVSYENASA